ncbi:MAG TPA: hypothetical protein VF808_13955 [Ktedonobacterales bacterium]
MALATWLLQVRAGLATMLEHPPQLTFAAAEWVSGAGPLVTGVGLALAGIAVIGAWIAASGSFRESSFWRGSQVPRQKPPAPKALAALEP